MSFIDALNEWVDSMTDDELYDSFLKSNEIMFTKREIENKVFGILRENGDSLDENGKISVDSEKVCKEISEYVWDCLAKQGKPIQSDIMTIDETAKYLSISKANLYQLTMKGKIPFYKPNGKLIYFNRKEVENWVYGIRGGEMIL